MRKENGCAFVWVGKNGRAQFIDRINVNVR